MSGDTSSGRGTTMATVYVHPDPERSVRVHCTHREDAVMIYLTEMHEPDSSDTGLYFSTIERAETWASELLIDLRLKMAELTALAAAEQ
jgi:hypothetical protein